jgi:WD40 repeat protein
VWNAETGDMFTQIKNQGPVWVCGISSDSRYLLSACKGDLSIHVWDARSGMALNSFQAHSHWITSCAVSHDTPLILTGARDNTVRLWDAAIFSAPPVPQGHSGPVFCVSFSPDGKRIFSCSKSDNFIKVWDADQPLLLGTWVNAHLAGILCVQHSPRQGSDWLISSSEDRFVKVWTASDGNCLRLLSGHTDIVISCCWSKNLSYIVSCSRDKSVRIWNTETFTCLKSLATAHHDAIISAAFSDDSRMLATGGGDNVVKVWQSGSFELIQELVNHRDAIVFVQFSPDGSQLLAAGRNHSVVIWETSTWDVLTTAIGYSNAPYCCTYVPIDHKSGFRLVMVSQERIVKLLQRIPSSSSYKAAAAGGTQQSGSMGIFTGLHPCTAVACVAVGGRLRITVGDEAGSIISLELQTESG